MDAYIVDAKRTAIGRSHKDKGCFKNVRADVMLAGLLQHFSDHVVAAEEIDDIYIGCVGQHLEQGKNIGRLAALLANYPATVPAATVNRLCGSSLQAFQFAARAVASGDADAVLAGGVEHMHHVPMAAALDYNRELLDRYPFPFTNMGLTAELLADDYQISRGAQDEFALLSHQKAVQAQSHLGREIIAIAGITDDQCPRAGSTLEALANLKTVFKEDGTVTAGNSSSLSDGASLSLIANDAFCQKNGLQARAQIIGSTVVGLDPCRMGLGPVTAVQKLLKRHRLQIGDIAVVELNEAFASQSIACIRELALPMEKVNPFGGAIALGHPLGCTGTRLVTTLVNALEVLDGEWGLATMCIGHGQGMATLVRRVA